jgi:hypothetical protein
VKTWRRLLAFQLYALTSTIEKWASGNAQRLEVPVATSSELNKKEDASKICWREREGERERERQMQLEPRKTKAGCHQLSLTFGIQSEHLKPGICWREGRLRVVNNL